MSSGDSTISTVIQWELEYAISHDYDIVSDRPETVVDFSAPPPPTSIPTIATFRWLAISLSATVWLPLPFFVLHNARSDFQRENSSHRDSLRI